MERKTTYSFIAYSFLLGLILSLLFFQYVTFTGKIVNVDTSASIDPGIKVLYDKFDGSTTEFLLYLDAELASLDSMTLERTSFGKIVFSSTVNLAQDADIQNIIDLDSNVNISNNYVKINTTRLTSLDSPAVVSIYNRFVQDPRVLKDGVRCPDSICTLLGHSNVTGTVTFSVAYFGLSVYSINETPEQVEVIIPGAGGGGGGGGGGSVKPIDELKKILLELDAPLSETLFSGDEKNVLIKLMNKGDFELTDITIEATTNAPDVKLSLSKVSIDSLSIEGEETLVLNIKSLADAEAHLGTNNYFVTLVAKVGNFDYESSIRLFITLKERNLVDRLEVLKKIEFTEDLFKYKKECEEYDYLIAESKKYYAESNFEMAQAAIDVAIESCRDIAPIGEWEDEEMEGLRKTGLAHIWDQRLGLKSTTNMLLYLIALIMVIFLFIYMLYYYKKKQDAKSETPYEQNTRLQTEFNELYYEIQGLLKKRDFISVRKKYVHLYSVYNKIRHSSVDRGDKYDYYRKLVAVHLSLDEAAEK